MNFEEHAAKPLLAAVGIPVPPSGLAASAEVARTLAEKIGPCVVKAQVPTGKRGKAGGIALAASADDAQREAARILGMDIAGHTVENVLVEGQIDISRELYVAILNDSESKGPLVLYSAEGGMEIEEIAADHPDKLLRYAVDIRRGIDVEALSAALPETEGVPSEAVVDLILKLFDAYQANDAELLEINPLVLQGDGTLIALDCKFTLDDSAIKRRQELAERGSPDKLSGLEARGQAAGLKFIELDGNVGILANGAGLTMTSMDAISHYGGRPANFLEIGGEAYSLGREALELVLANPNVKSLLVNFCGGFARTDVMAGGIVEAWEKVQPTIPVFFTIHGTGEDEARAMVRERLGIEPYELMDDAVRAAIAAAEEAA